MLQGLPVLFEECGEALPAAQHLVLRNPDQVQREESESGILLLTSLSDFVVVLPPPSPTPFWQIRLRDELIPWEVTAGVWDGCRGLGAGNVACCGRGELPSPE